MQIPERIPGLRVASFLVLAYGVVWIALEGNLGRVVVLAVGTAVVAVGHGVQRLGGGRRFAGMGVVAVGGVLGVLVGGGSGLSTLVLMAVKTGLHAHGPEFGTAEVAWVVGQWPWWAVAGGVGGVGLALLALAWRGAGRR